MIEIRINNKEIMRNTNQEVMIVETNNYIKIIRDNTDQCFNIPKDTLGETILIDGVVCSKWINELKNKSWCPLKVLYSLAEMIEQKNSNEDINWISQFYKIEMARFQYKKFRQEFSIKKEDFTYSEFKNSPYNSLIKIKEEDIDGIIKILINNFEPWGIHDKIMNR